jgi:uncharacterized membrane protein YdbT with pleckstrin-like domain
MVGAEGLAEGERVVLKGRQHWKTVLRPVLVLALLIAALLVVLIAAPLPAVGRLAVGGAALMLALLFVAAPLLRWWVTIWELTTRRLRLRSGVLTRTGRDFPLSRISDVSFHQGVLDRLLGCGRLIVESPGEHGQLVLNEVPHVRHVQAQLFQLVEDERLRLGTQGGVRPDD